MVNTTRVLRGLEYFVRRIWEIFPVHQACNHLGTGEAKSFLRRAQTMSNTFFPRRGRASSPLVTGLPRRLTAHTVSATYLSLCLKSHKKLMQCVSSLVAVSVLIARLTSSHKTTMWHLLGNRERCLALRVLFEKCFVHWRTIVCYSQRTLLPSHTKPSFISTVTQTYFLHDHWNLQTPIYRPWHYRRGRRGANLPPAR